MPYYKPPPGLPVLSAASFSRQALVQFARDTRLRNIFRNLTKNYRLTLSVIQGQESDSQKPLTLLLAGSGHNKAYLLNLIFDDHCSEVLTRTLWLWQVPYFISQFSADMLIAIDPKDGAARYLSGRTTFNVPIWIRGEIDIKTANGLLKTGENIKSDLRRIRNNKLGYRITRDPALFRDFYYGMHLPYIENTFGGAAFTVSYKEMKKKIDTSELMLITMGDEVIAGGIILYEKGGARAWFIGVKDGNHDYVKRGALSALYYFGIPHLEKKGFLSEHVGSSRAFLKDGVLQYKKKWGMRIIGARRGNFVIDVLKYSAASRSFLANNPFVQRNDDVFTGVYFLDEDNPDAELKSRDIYKSFYFPGMKQLDICRIKKSGDGAGTADTTANMLDCHSSTSP